MEALPSSVFSESNLRGRFPHEFDEAAETGLIGRIATDPEYVVDPGGRRLRVTTDAQGRHIGLDDRDEHAAPVPLSNADITLWSLQMAGLALAARQLNRLTGDSGRLSDRLYLLGDSIVGGERTGVVLGLFDGHHGAAFTLPELSSRRYRRYLVLCPTYLPGPDQRRLLEASSIFLERLSGDFRVDWSAVIERPPSAPLVVLSPEEEQQHRDIGAQSRLPITITGRRAGARQVVLIGGAPVELARAQFALFIRLVVALFESGDGYTERGTMGTGGGLVEEGYYRAASIDQALSRLRAPIRAALGTLDAKQFIEVSGSHVRISTHRRYVSWESEPLRTHPDQLIRKLMARLEAVKRQSRGPASRGPSRRRIVVPARRGS